MTRVGFQMTGPHGEHVTDVVFGAKSNTVTNEIPWSPSPPVRVEGGILGYYEPEPPGPRIWVVMRGRDGVIARFPGDSEAWARLFQESFGGKVYRVMPGEI